ncbi:MAG: M43 family zinc metalloprotease [Bacteroidota bacterium]
MKKLILLIGVFVSIMASAQSVRQCGTMHNLERLKTIDPSIDAAMNDIEAHTNHFISTTPEGSRAVITIPVVVHVVYNTTTQNISDAQIASQISILNKDFRKLNTDAALIPSIFTSVSADCEVNFCMAQRTPTGAATNGIVRVSTATTSFIDDDRVKSSTTGGSTAWDATKYLNIWVCNLGGGLLGYAQFPGGPAATDGVVINYTAFGNTGTAASPFNLGRTATHEIGHWLNLRHIWGDATCGNDLVSDTPPHNASNFGCPTYPHLSTCTGTPTEMTMNYMDYTNDACMYMYTAGQKARMQALFAVGGARVGLTTSLGCTPPATGGTCGTPSGLAASSITSAAATLSWTAVSGATSYNVQYKLSTATTWTTTSTASTSIALSGLSASSTYNYQVQAVCSVTGTYSVASSFTTLAASTTCGTDTYEPNNTLAAFKTLAVNTNVTAKICPTLDEDWYRFSTVSTARNFKVDLTTLPADYDLYVYNSSGTQIGSSVLGGTTSETYKLNGGAIGNYYVRIIGYSGAFNATTNYTIRVTTSSSTLRGLEDGEEVVALEQAFDGVIVFPNPAIGKVMVNYFAQDSKDNVQMYVYDMTGTVVHKEIFSTTNGLNQVEFNTQTYSNGMYMVVIQDGDKTYSNKVQIQN